MEITPNFAASECCQRARTICFRSKIQAGLFWPLKWKSSTVIGLANQFSVEYRRLFLRHLNSPWKQTGALSRQYFWGVFVFQYSMFIEKRLAQGLINKDMMMGEGRKMWNRLFFTWIIWNIQKYFLSLQRERRNQVEPRCAERWHLCDDEQFDLAAWFPSLS